MISFIFFHSAIPYCYNVVPCNNCNASYRNGVGKSTFLKVLTGQLSLTHGAVRIGDTARIGYYEQSGLNLTEADERSTVLQVCSVLVLVTTQKGYIFIINFGSCHLLLAGFQTVLKCRDSISFVML